MCRSGDLGWIVGWVGGKEGRKEGRGGSDVEGSMLGKGYEVRGFCH